MRYKGEASLRTAAAAGDAGPDALAGATNTAAVADADANGYVWTIPTGWSGTSTSNSITLTSGTAGQNGNITVTFSVEDPKDGTYWMPVNAGEPYYFVCRYYKPDMNNLPKKPCK